MGISSEPILNELLGPMRIYELFFAEETGRGLAHPLPPLDADTMMLSRSGRMAGRQKIFSEGVWKNGQKAVQGLD